MRSRALVAAAVATMLLVLAPVAAVAARPGPSRVAPYADMSLYPAFDLAAAARSGISHYTLAFVLSGGGCRAAWGGVTPLAGRPYAADIAALRRRGGDVIASFGGEAGVELAQACPSAGALAAQYAAVIAAYRLTSIDFDIEGAAVADRASVVRRAEAITRLQAAARRARRRLTVSLTLPVLPSGLTADGLGVIRASIRAGARIDLVNLMAMDYGADVAPAGVSMATEAERAAEATERQLGGLYPGRSAAARWRMIGLTPMLGVNDTPGETFGLADAARLVRFGNARHLGRLAYWSATRDRPCAGSVHPYAEPTCSSVAQRPWAFARAFSAYTG